MSFPLLGLLCFHVFVVVFLRKPFVFFLTIIVLSDFV